MSAIFKAPAILLAAFLNHVMVPRRTYAYFDMFDETGDGHFSGGTGGDAFNPPHREQGFCRAAPSGETGLDPSSSQHLRSHVSKR